MKKFKIPHLDFLPIILISFICFKLIFETSISFSAAWSFAYSCIAYFVWGLVIAYLFNPVMMFFDKLIASKKDIPKIQSLKRGLVVAFIFLLLAGTITVFVVALIPAIKDGIEQISERMPSYISSIQEFTSSLTGRMSPEINSLINTYLENLLDMFYGWIKEIDFNSLGTHIGTAVSGSATAVIRFVFGIVVSIYFLFSKERLLLALKRFIFATFPTSRATRIIKTSTKINSVFKSFISSKLLQSLIILVIGIVVLNILHIPLATLIAFIIAITNLIPYFGPYIGAIPSILITLMFDPIKALWVLIYSIGIQILDNLILGPKIMSDQVGISPILVIAGVTIGGAFGGILGMFLGVPIVATIKLVFYDPFIERRLTEKDIILKK